LRKVELRSKLNQVLVGIERVRFAASCGRGGGDGRSVLAFRCAVTVIERFMPTNPPGARPVNDRKTVSGIMHVIRSGCRWHDCPPAYGPSTTVFNRFNRWSRRGFWRGMLANVGASRLDR